VRGYDPTHLDPDSWTGNAYAIALEPLKEKGAEIHRGSRRRGIGSLREAGYTPAIAITEPDPIRPSQMTILWKCFRAAGYGAGQKVGRFNSADPPSRGEIADRSRMEVI
jgi:hypothetical protein